MRITSEDENRPAIMAPAPKVLFECEENRPHRHGDVR